MPWGVHCCPLDRECREYGAPWRVHVETPRFHVGVALGPGSRFAYVDRRARWTTFSTRER